MKSSEKKGIRAMMILEIMGRPKEYLLENLKEIIKKINEEKGVEVKEKTINEPKLMENQHDLYTSFAEVEFEAEELIHLAVLMFKYMPSHIEIISPENLVMKNNDATDLFSELCRRLHGYDEVARIMSVEKNILEKKLKEMLNKEPKNPSIKMSSELKKADNKKSEDKNPEKKKKD